MKKNAPRKTPRKSKPQKKKLFNKSFLLITFMIISILIAFVTGSFYKSEIDQVTNTVKPILFIDEKELPEEPQEKDITYAEKIRALEVEYSTENDKKYLDKTNEEELKENKQVFHFEEPNLEEIDKHEENKEEILIQIPDIIEESKNKNIHEEKTPKTIEEKAPSIIENKLNKPKLAIIIDDVTTSSQIRRIQDIGYTVNMAFLPPTTGHKNSAKITENLDKYMIHLPLQASSSKYEEENTLHIDDDINKIENRIKYLKELYPGTNFLNNHTGSKFTSNKEAMDKLFQVLKKYNYTFIDSRTTAKSMAKESSKEYGVKMFSRNIFLDNKKDSKYIQNQLKKAIKIAKKRGMAIAIGHPYSITFKTLKESKHLLDELELVYVQDL